MYNNNLFTGTNFLLLICRSERLIAYCHHIADRRKMHGRLCRSVLSFCQAAMVFVLIHSFSPVMSTAIHKRVEGLQFFNKASISWLLR